jgi:serine protease Do
MTRSAVFFLGVVASGAFALACFAGAISTLESEVSALFDEVKPSVPTVVYTHGKRDYVSTGIVMDREGHILTTKDFSGKPTSVEVQFPKDKRKALLLGHDRESKLAVLKVDGGGLTPVKMGDSDKVAPTAWVMIVGNSLGISPSVSTGVISGRRTEDDMLHVSASINPGNSGAGVFNSEGELIGIVSASLARPFYLAMGEGADKFGASINLLRRGELPLGGSGLLIPSRRARDLMKEIIEHGITSYGWLGVRLQTLDDLTKSALGVDQGALVSDVVEKSPAEQSGVKEGDVIVSYSGKKVASVQGLAEMVRKTKPGQKVDFVVIRKGKKKTLKAKIGERPEDELLSRQWHIEMPALDDYYSAMELYKSAQKKELDAEVEKLKEEIKKLKEELKKQKGGGL